MSISILKYAVKAATIRFPCGINGHLNHHIGKGDAQGLNRDGKTNSKDLFGNCEIHAGKRFAQTD